MIETTPADTQEQVEDAFYNYYREEFGRDYDPDGGENSMLYLFFTRGSEVRADLERERLLKIFEDLGLAAFNYHIKKCNHDYHNGRVDGARALLQKVQELRAEKICQQCS